MSWPLNIVSISKAKKNNYWSGNLTSFIKKISINSDKDLKNFYNKVWLYKSFLFVFTKFESDNPEIKNIIEALNIKNRRKRLTYVYDATCLQIDNYWKNINFCGFKNNKCYVQRCNKSPYINGCCRLCPHQSESGCTTSNSSCKFFYCSQVKKRHKILEYSDIKILKVLSIRYKPMLTHNYFSTREQILSDLYCGSILIFSLRLILRHIKRICYINKNK